MRKHMILMASAALLFASNAIAADTTIIGSSPSQNWSGAYVVGLAGYDDSAADLEHQNVNPFGGPGGEYQHAGSLGTYGGAIGYNHDLGGLVIGAELALRTGAELDDGGEWAIYDNFTSTSIETTWAVKARLGYAVGRFLPYVVAGYAGADVDTRQSYEPGGPPLTWEDTQAAHGYVIGGGLDVKLTERAFVGVEYNYADFGDVSFSAPASNEVLTNINASVVSHSVFGRLGFRF